MGDWRVAAPEPDAIQRHIAQILRAWGIRTQETPLTHLVVNNTPCCGVRLLALRTQEAP